MKALRSFHWLAASLSSESSIRMARYRGPSWRQSATWTRSLPSKTCTSSFLIGGGEAFLATAVTVRVTAAAERTVMEVSEANVRAKAASSVRGLGRMLTFMENLLLLAQSIDETQVHLIRCGNIKNRIASGTQAA